jgi:hypothetical protein
MYGTRKRLDREHRVQPTQSGVPLIDVWGVETDWSSPDDKLPGSQLFFDPASQASDEFKLHGSNSDFEYEITGRVRSAERAILGECSDFPPAAVVFNGDIYLGWIGQGNLQLNVMNLRTFKKSVFTETGIGGLGLASFRGRLYVAWTDAADNTLKLMYSQDAAGGWTGVGLPWADSFTAPALASNSDGTRLCIAWTGTDDEKHLNVMFSGDGESFDPPVMLDETSGSAPFLCNQKPAKGTVEQGVIMSWSGTDFRINMMAVFNGGSVGQKQTLDELTDAAPAWMPFRVTPSNPVTWLAWRGVEGDGQLNLASSIWVGSIDTKEYTGETSIGGSCLVNFNDQCLYMFWTATDDEHHLNYKVVRSA